MVKSNLISAVEAIAWGCADAGCGCVSVHNEIIKTQYINAINTRGPQLVNTCSVQLYTEEKINFQSAIKAANEGNRAISLMDNKSFFSVSANINSGHTSELKAGMLIFTLTEFQVKRYDPRIYGKWALLPMIEPATLQEVYDSIDYGFLLSENLHRPVLYCVSSMLLSVLAGITFIKKKGRRPPVFQSIKNYEAGSISEYIPTSANYLSIMAHLTRISTQSQFNRYIVGSNRSLGIIAFGNTFNLVNKLKQTDDIEFPIAKISQYPLPEKWIRKIFTECREVLVLEEGLPIYEELLRGFFDNEQIKGRLDGSLSDGSMLSVASIRKVLGLKEIVA